MALPAYIPVRTVGFRGVLELEQGKGLTAKVAVRSSGSLRWADTGELFETLGGTFTSGRGASVTFPLPVTDDDGWLTTANEIIDVSEGGAYTHTYTATVVVMDASGRQVGDVYEYGPFVVPASDSTLWLDELEEQTTTAGSVVARPTVYAVNGQDGDVTITAAGLGAYVKPGTGVPKTDLAEAVQTSLGKADTALQPDDVGTMAAQDAADYLTADQTNAAIVEKVSTDIPDDETDIGAALKATIAAEVAPVASDVADVDDRVAVLESRQGGGLLVGAIGDSITAGDGNGYVVGGYTTALGDAPIGYAYALSDGRWRLAVNAGIGGQRSDQIAARLQAEIIDVGCTVCVITSFYWNNIGQGRSVAQTVSDLDGMFTLLRGAGVAPVVCLPTPDGVTGSSTGRRLLCREMAVAVAALCRDRGVPVVDPFPTLVDPATGLLNAAYNKDGTVHPLPAGYKAFGALISAALERIIAPGPVPEAVTAVDPTDLLGGKGLFLTDTSGVGAGWTAGADAAWSIVTDAAVIGRMQQLSVSGGTTYKDMLVGTTGTQFQVGDTLELSGIMTNSGGTAIPRIRFVVGGVGNPYITFEPKGALTRGRFCLRWVVPAGATTVNLRYQMQTGTGTAAIGQVAVRKLS